MNRKGTIAMTKYTYQRMAEPKAFVLLFDDVNNRIGLKPAALATRNAYRVVPNGKYGGKMVHAYRLTREFGIDVRETIEFKDPEIDQDGILVLDLRTARVAGRAWTKERREEWKKKHAAASKPLAVSGEREISSQLPVVSSQTETSGQPSAVSVQPHIGIQPSAISVRPERAAVPSAVTDEDDGSCDCFQCLSGNKGECLEIGH